MIDIIDDGPSFPPPRQPVYTAAAPSRRDKSCCNGRWQQSVLLNQSPDAREERSYPTVAWKNTRLRPQTRKHSRELLPRPVAACRHSTPFRMQLIFNMPALSISSPDPDPPAKRPPPSLNSLNRPSFASSLPRPSSPALAAEPAPPQNATPQLLPNDCLNEIFEPDSSTLVSSRRHSAASTLSIDESESEVSEILPPVGPLLAAALKGSPSARRLRVFKELFPAEAHSAEYVDGECAPMLVISPPSMSSRNPREAYILVSSFPDYRCAFVKDILRQGRIYITTAHICFKSN
ncbi:hypothetical protein BDK51DRAFT_48733, partial [Blyttiomyces helicus]